MRRSAMWSSIACLLAAAASGNSHAQLPTKPDLSIVLVHGAFENGAVWDGVVSRLQRRGLRVVVVHNSLASLEADAANTERVIDNQPGGVILVGHSFGGVVITEAGNNPKVKALVYLAAASPSSGQSGLDEGAPYPKPALLGHLFVDSHGLAYATDSGMLDIASDLPESRRKILWATQAPIALSAFQGKVTRAAWETVPSWSLVADDDRAISPREEADAAVRIRARVRYVKSGHMVMLTKPGVVTEVILEAYAASAAQP